MKIVVDIPDEEYESYALAITFGMGNTAIRRILNGTPFPEGAEILTKEAYSDLCLRASLGLEQGSVLDKIRAEIEQMDFDFGDFYDHTYVIKEMVLEVIDRYRVKSEEGAE